jgi:hypothetical protein
MKSSRFSSFRFLCGFIALLAGAAVAHAAPPPAGTVGTAYSYQISTTPAAAAGTVYSATNLPPGLGIGSSTGLVSGTPTAAGTYSGVFSLTSNSVTNNLSYSITIAPGSGTPVLSGPTTANATVGTAFAGYTPTLAGGSAAATSFNVTGLPPGFVADGTTGTITSNPLPTAPGTYAVGISGNNAAGTGAVLTLTITVAPAAGAPTINSAATLAALPGVALSPSYQITTVNSDATGFAASGLPVGLSLDSTTGIISGAPSAAGMYTVTLTASNVTGTSSAFTLTITVGAVVTNSATVNATAGTAFNLALTSSTLSASITGYNVSGLPAGLSASNTGVISGTPTTAGNYLLTVSANTAGGTGPSSTITLTVAPAVGGGGGGPVITPVPTITSQPAAVTVTAGGTATFAVTATSSTGGSLTYQWLLGGVALSGQTSSTLTLTNVQAAQAGSYSVTVAAVGGTSVTSNAAALTVTAAAPTPTPVTITSQPASQSVNAGASVTFTVAASGSGTLAYQWAKNGVAISGATAATYSITNVSTTDAGSFTVAVSNGSSSATSNAAVLTVTQVAVTRLVNVSVSGFSGLVPQNLAVGLSIGGTGSKNVLIRAVGPTLSEFGVTGVLASPQLTLNSGLGQIGANAGWGGTTALSQAFLQTGAFALPTTSLDAALLMSLASGTTYSANVVGANSSTGIVLLEAYDADSGTPTARFVNLSARGVAGSGGKVMTIGFVISGTAPESLLLRGIGPGLAGFGLTGVLPTTQLTLFSQTGSSLASNTGWSGTPALTAAFNAVGAFSLPATSADSALLVTLQPGTYTVQLTGAGSSTASGVALIELYEMP